MQPNNLTMQDGTVLDPRVLKVMGAIRNVESGGKYNAVGDNGESHGAYQFNKDNYKNWAKQYNVDPNDMSPANQNKVAYMRIKEMKDQGLQPDEIAARWNGATFNKTTNKYDYNNPAYGDKFRAALTGSQVTPQTTDVAQAKQKLASPTQAPEVTQHVTDMLDQGKTHQDVQDYLKSVRAGSEAPASSVTIPKVDPLQYYKDVGKQFTEGGEKILSSVEGGAKTINEGIEQGKLPGIENKAEGTLKGVEGLAQSFLGTFAGAAQTVFSPVTAIVSKMVGDVANKLKENPALIGPYNNIAQNLDDFAKAHPTEATVIGDGVNALLAAVGEEIGGKKIKTGGGAKTLEEGVTTGESVGTKMATEDLKNTLQRTQGGRTILTENPDVIKVWQKEGAFPDIVEGANGKQILDTKNAYEHLGSKISAIEDGELQTKLESLNTGKVADMRPLEDLKQEAIAKVNASFKSSGNVESAINKVNKYFDDYQKSYGDYVSLSDINDMKRGIRKSVNFNSELLDQDTAFQIGQVFMKDIEDSATKLGLGDIHEINGRMAELIKAQEALSKLNGKPAPLKGWSKFKANNPIKAKILSGTAKAGLHAAGIGAAAELIK